MKTDEKYIHEPPLPPPLDDTWYQMSKNVGKSKKCTTSIVNLILNIFCSYKNFCPTAFIKVQQIRSKIFKRKKSKIIC